MRRTEKTASQPSALDRVLAQIAADGEREAALRETDEANEVSVTVLLDFFGRLYTVTLTGIAPFEAVLTVGPLTGTPGWTILGQPHTGRCGARRTIAKVVLNGEERWGGLPLLTEDQARALEATIHATLHQRAA